MVVLEREALEGVNGHCGDLNKQQHGNNLTRRYQNLASFQPLSWTEI
jgi:hypothetical protein